MRLSVAVSPLTLLEGLMQKRKDSKGGQGTGTGNQAHVGGVCASTAMKEGKSSHLEQMDKPRAIIFVKLVRHRKTHVFENNFLCKITIRKIWFHYITSF